MCIYLSKTNHCEFHITISKEQTNLLETGFFHWPLHSLSTTLMSFAVACIGARIVISHPQGREVLEKQRQQYPDVISSDLPEKSTLTEVAAEHCFELTNYVDEPGLYLAALKFVGAS